MPPVLLEGTEWGAGSSWTTPTPVPTCDPHTGAAGRCRGPGGGSRWSGKLRRGRKMKGGRVRRSCFASLHVSPASFPPSSFLRTQRRARSRRRRPVEPPVSPHRSPPCPQSPPRPPGGQSGDPAVPRVGSDGGGGTGGAGGPGSAAPPQEPPGTFPAAPHKLCPAGKLRAGRGALTCCGRGAAHGGMLGGRAGGPRFREFPAVRDRSPRVRRVLRGWGGPCGPVPLRAGPERSGVSRCGTARCSGGLREGWGDLGSVPKQRTEGSCAKALRSSGHNAV